MDEKRDYISICNRIVNAASLGMSDIHLSPSKPVVYRTEGIIIYANDGYILKKEDTQSLLDQYVVNNIRKQYDVQKSCNISIQIDNIRARLHFYDTKDGVCISCRLIPLEVQSIDSLRVPIIVKDWITRKGIIVISGLANNGKTTTIAAMVNKLNTSTNSKIVVLEDPIEYIHTDKRSCIFQREIYTHTPSYMEALIDVAREDADMVVIGEVRNAQAMDAVFSMAEAGLSVYTSIHANSSLETIERIVNLFPLADYERIYNRLSWSLVGVLNQKLLNKAAGGRILACDVLTCTDAVKNMIKTGKIQMIRNIIDTSRTDEIVSYENYKADLVKRGLM